MSASSPLPEKPGELLRFTTAGSVDDGKSTLIGRLLYDSKSIFEDQLEDLERSRDLTGDGRLNLANLTDGLRAEREQGITIDVAYRYFATPKRKFIIADTPGHIQYTRNMVTGASNANLAVVLIDARLGVVEQSRRHAYLASLLRIPHLVVCVNKMDLVDFSEARFLSIQDSFRDFSLHLQVQDITFLPVSALHGDNIVTRSERTPWYQGPTLLAHLEDVHVAGDLQLHDPRLPVQFVIRPQSDAHHDYRGYAGQIAGGQFRVGDEVVALPSGRRSRIREIHGAQGPVDSAVTPQSVTLLLEDALDICRGDLLARSDNLPEVGRDIDAMLCWMDETPSVPRRRYLIKHHARTSRALLQTVEFKMDIQNQTRAPGGEILELNDIARVRLKTMDPLCYDYYRQNRITGSFILIDEQTHQTVAAGMICHPHKTPPPPEYDDYAI